MGMILVMESLDMLGVASILSFMTVLANPEVVQTSAMLNMAFITSRHSADLDKTSLSEVV